MLVASNTSPISNLAIVNHLDLLRLQFGEVCIPVAVKLELDRLNHPEALQAIGTAFGGGWIKVLAVQDETMVRVLEFTLDRGEAEAIALALETSAGLALLDEREGRMAAERAGLRVAGVLGVLLRSKRDQQIDAVKPVIDALRESARFFVSRNLERRILELAGE